MCFRPSAVGGINEPIKCPKCGTDVPSGSNKCPSCGATAESLGMGAPGMPGMPMAPGMPGIPTAPGAPATAPGA